MDTKSKKNLEYYKKLFEAHDTTIASIIQDIHENNSNSCELLVKKRKYSDAMGYHNDYISVQKYK